MRARSQGARLIHLWYDRDALSIVSTRAITPLNASGVYGISGAEAKRLDLSRAGPSPGAFDNFRLEEKRAYAMVLSGVEIEGGAGVVHMGFDRFYVGSQGLWIPLHDQGFGVRSKPRIVLSEAISVVSLSSANYFHFLCEVNETLNSYIHLPPGQVVPRIVLSKQSWPAVFNRAPLLVGLREVSNSTFDRPDPTLI